MKRIRIGEQVGGWYVYLYHFKNNGYGYERNGTFVTPKHYCGVTNNLKNRDQTHKSGNGSKFIKQVHTVEQLDGEMVVAIECGDKKAAYQLERTLKNSKNLKRTCPCCTENARSILNNCLGRLNIDVPF